jgi:DNA-binding NarL/FixJ family response regulator
MYNIDTADVFEAVRRGYGELEYASNSEILEYFSDADWDAMSGHISNIKGILFEQAYVEKLEAAGIHAELFDATNHPVVDLAIIDGTDIVSELQLKATDSVAYINATLHEYPDIPIVATSEVAQFFNHETVPETGAMVIDSGIEEAGLESLVTETLADEVFNPFSTFSIVRWLIGIPF